MDLMRSCVSQGISECYGVASLKQDSSEREHIQSGEG